MSILSVLRVSETNHKTLYFPSTEAGVEATAPKVKAVSMESEKMQRGHVR